MPERGLYQEPMVAISDAVPPAPLISDLSAFQKGEGLSFATHLNRGRVEFMQRHTPGFRERDPRILFLGAHPDDTALAAGADIVLLNETRIQGHDSGLWVVTATPGQLGKNADSSIRILEDGFATNILGADGVHNLGFMDGSLTRDAYDLTARIGEVLDELKPHIVITPAPDDMVHPDHVMIQQATTDALRCSGRNPIVIYTDFQAGEISPEQGYGRSVGYALTADENETFIASFDAHVSEMAVQTDDILAVKSRTSRRSAQLGTKGFAGIVRQDPAFSSEPIEVYLGKKAISI